MKEVQRQVETDNFMNTESTLACFIGKSRTKKDDGT